VTLAAGGRAVPRSRRARCDCGFVLMLVVFMLFAISVAGATGYLVVNSDFSMARHSTDRAEALAVAYGGLQRFVAEQLGTVNDSAGYAMGEGIAMVTARRVFDLDTINHLYYVRSEGTVAELSAPASPARRVVGGYAVRRVRPLAHHAANMIAATTVDVDNGGVARGFDRASFATCQGGGASPITGVIATSNVIEGGAGDVTGSPPSEAWPGGSAQMYDSVGLRWDVLTDPSFPMEFENTPPDFGSLPADSFPIVRYTGDLGASSYWNGRGVLIVTGTFDPFDGFHWDGIVLAGAVDDIIEGRVHGMLIAGLNGPNPQPVVDFRMENEYDSCRVYQANESLSYLELMEHTVFEAN
jgi:hypothetical protein